MQSMLADFKAVEPFGKKAMRVLQRRALLRVSFGLLRRRSLFISRRFLSILPRNPIGSR
jgi:hypothetical protein